MRPPEQTETAPAGVHGARVAVVIPCFDDGATLREAVDSARGERVTEIVVVDDGSTDPATLRLFERLEEEDVRVVHRENGGLGAARMTGVGATQAEYVFCLDADDRLVPGALGVLAAALDGDPALGVVWGDYRTFGDVSYRQATAAVLDPWHISIQNDLPACALIRRSALEQTAGWELSRGYEDWDLWMAFAEKGIRGRRIDVVAYEYRIHGRRMLVDAAERHDELLAVLRSRHPGLFRRRRRLWLRSGAPLALRLALPPVLALPLSPRRKRLLAGAACHLAHRRGVRLLVRRAREATDQV